MAQRLVVVGNWQRRALDTRAYLVQHHDCSFSPLTGATAEAWPLEHHGGAARRLER